MIIINTFEEVEKINTISEAMKEELKNYFKEIAKGIVGEHWKDYKLDDVGKILAVENEDTIDALERYGLMQDNKKIPAIVPEFAIKIKVEGKQLLRIIWVCGDSYGFSMYYPLGQFGEEFDNWIKIYLIDEQQ